jgi:FlaA1/EpsC-like NDP-sugar epimerase
MLKPFDLNLVISEVTGRAISLMLPDLDAQHGNLTAAIKGKAVLVIGGAGTIGSNFIKALLPYQPSKLVVVDINENGLTELVRDIRSTAQLFVPDQLLTYPMNFGDEVFRKMFVHEGPFQIVANFAAHKHVRSEKDRFSIEAMVDNNVLKAKDLLDLLAKHPPEHFFCVSTDKAANPVNVMGASKKLMEDVIMAYGKYFKVTTARFANVAFSNGSLPFGFIERLMKRQPFSAPRDVKRFFVSPQESGQICLLACILGKSGDVFFPKLDMHGDLKPFTLVVERLLANLGYTLDLCASEQEAREKALKLNTNSTAYPVYYFNSDTSGEKHFEEFYTENETLDMDSFIHLGIVKDLPGRSLDNITMIFERIRELFDSETLTKHQLIEELKAILGNFDHIETGKTLDQKM